MKIFRASARGGSKDHLVRCEIYCQSKTLRGLGIGNLKWKNISLLARWHWRFPVELNSLWHKVIKSIHRSELDKWDVFPASSIAHYGPWKSISGVWTLFAPLTCFQVRDESRASFWQGNHVGDQLLASKFSQPYNLSTGHKCPYNHFHFKFPKFLLGLPFYLTPIQKGYSRYPFVIRPFVAKSSLVSTWTWVLESSRLYWCKSFFDHVTNNSSLANLTLPRVLESFGSSKVKVFSWTTFRQKLNTRNMLQVC